MISKKIKIIEQCFIHSDIDNLIGYGFVREAVDCYKSKGFKSVVCLTDSQLKKIIKYYDFEFFVHINFSPPQNTFELAQTAIANGREDIFEFLIGHFSIDMSIGFFNQLLIKTASENDLLSTKYLFENYSKFSKNIIPTLFDISIKNNDILLFNYLTSTPLGSEMAQKSSTTTSSFKMYFKNKQLGK
ncbi:hypothetical protein ACTFIW_012697 [Dictyostelium discoideum]